MPLDAVSELVGDLTLDPLLKLGIIPVDAAEVKAYKTQYRKAWQAAHPFDIGNIWATVSCGRRSLDIFLRDPMYDIRYKGFRASDCSGVPAPLARLAQRLDTELPTAKFSVDYFDLDPILNVSYIFDGKRRKVCLGIWDGDEVKAIATVL